ncbi:MAG: formylglycine-generating enzyme family protein [bacterium]|nr:formylglycine-generating enzyme family protein [bacterium]
MNALRYWVLVAVVAGVCASADAAVFQPDVYGTGATMADYMRPVAGGGQPSGPAYDFNMGKYEITNGQYDAFLNDAQLDGGATGKGSNMYFQDDGRVRIAPSGATIFRASPASFAQIDYDLAAPLGQRFTPIVKQGMDMSPHPATNVSWYGAAKFANWLTLDRGFGAGQRTYTEGPNAEDWHPATISTADWQTRDLNTSERQALVDNYAGYRLPMDDQSATASTYNEFYKAAAWDPVNQVNHTYGFGRDTIDNLDANGYRLHADWENYADDPFEAGFDPDTTPVGFYDGTTWLRSDWDWPDPAPEFNMFAARLNENAYGIFDFTGNADEWVQDAWVDGSPERATRGGAWANSAEGINRLVVDYRESHFPQGTGSNIGFRLTQVPEPTIAVYFVLGAGLLLRRSR